MRESRDFSRFEHRKIRTEVCPSGSLGPQTPAPGNLIRFVEYFHGAGQQENLVRAQPRPDKTCESWKNRSRSAKETVSHRKSRRGRRPLPCGTESPDDSLASAEAIDANCSAL